MSKFKPGERIIATSSKGYEYEGTVIKYHELNDPDVAYSVSLDKLCDIMCSEQQLRKLEEL